MWKKITAFISANYKMPCVKLIAAVREIKYLMEMYCDQLKSTTWYEYCRK